MGNATSQQNNNKASLVPEAARSSNGKRSRVCTAKPTKKHMSNVQLVEEYWCNAVNRHDLQRILKFCAPGCQCWFAGSDLSMGMEEFVRIILLVNEAIPENYATWDLLEETTPGVVRIENFVGHATHTDKPFSFGPSLPIPATGTVPCNLTIMVKNGKMVKFVIDAYRGDLVGPPRYGQEIGIWGQPAQ